ncbi:MAG: hypothetical protein JXQ71_06850 [Verrucomicrobia bacterium]|nr:hypothetical protein [Verrucomicrobiota bacterium]
MNGLLNHLCTGILLGWGVAAGAAEAPAEARSPSRAASAATPASPTNRGVRPVLMGPRAGRGMTNAPRRMSAEEWRAKRLEYKERLARRAETLRTKKAQGTLTPAEQKQLAHMEELLKRFQANAALDRPPQPASPPARRHGR